MSRLPASIDLPAYRALRAAPERWRDAAAGLATDLGLDPAPLQPLGGSNLVAACGDRVLKLFPPFLRHQWEAERCALRVVQDRLSIATPHLLHEGERDGWTYLVMDRLAGRSLEDVWPGLDAAARVDLLGQIGALIAEVHAVPPGELVALDPPWTQRLAAQRAGCVTRQRERGLPAHLVDQLEAYLDRTAEALPPPAPTVLLTGEYTPENLLVDAVGGRPDDHRASGWRLVGLLDFGDATTGPATYDLLGPATFLAAGDPRALRALLAGRGYPADALTPRLRDGLMALLLLHRHSDLPVQLRIDGWRAAATLDELAAIAFPF